MAVTRENQSLVDFALGVRDGDLPERARGMAIDAVTDAIGCGLAGTKEPLVPMLDAVVEARRAEDDGTAGILIGTTRMASGYDAALYNGALIHALDYDDTSHPGHTHPSTVLVPALFAIAADPAISGRDVVTAYVVGLEVMGKLAQALNMAHYKRGWHATATFGTLGAAVACGRLLGLTPEQLEMAIGIAASCASGVRANVGTMTKPLHAGMAARNGVFAALLAREGFTANPQALTHPTGFYRTFSGLRGDETINEAPLREYGKSLEILTEFGLALKPYPCCGATHPAVEAAILLGEELGDRVDRIRDIRVGVNDLVFQILVYEKPSTPLEGKFSMHYCIASALVDRKITFETFTDTSRLQSPRLHALMEVTHLETDERTRSLHADFTEFPAVVTVTLDDGTRFEKFVPFAIGKPQRWFTKERLREKFFDCGRQALPEAAVAGLFDVLQGIESLPNLKPVLDRLRFDARASAPQFAGAAR